MRRLLGFVALVAIAAGCKPAEAPAQFTPPTPAQITVEQFRTLGYLAGRWRGTLTDGSSPFYESYEVADDSTITGNSWTDSTFTVASDTSHIALRGGVVMSGTNYTVTSLDSLSVRFAPNAPGRNRFTWTRADTDHWTATLEWTDPTGAAKSRIYQMTRVTRP